MKNLNILFTTIVVILFSGNTCLGKDNYFGNYENYLSSRDTKVFSDILNTANEPSIHNSEILDDELYRLVYIAPHFTPECFALYRNGTESYGIRYYRFSVMEAWSSFSVANKYNVELNKSDYESFKTLIDTLNVHSLVSIEIDVCLDGSEFLLEVKSENENSLYYRVFGVNPNDSGYVFTNLLEWFHDHIKK